MKPRTRVGVSKDEPIMISDSEEDDADGGSASTSRLPTAYSASSSSAQPLVRPSIEQSEKHQQSMKTVKSKRKTHAKHSKSRVGSQVQTRKPVPGYIAENSQDGYKERDLESQSAPYPSPTATVRAHHSERESSILMGTSEPFCHVKEHIAGSYEYRARKPSPQYSLFPKKSARSRKGQNLSLQSEVQNKAAGSDDGDDNDDFQLTLADIPDFDLRSKLAQLMAVAPAIPVRDLYNLLIDSKGVFPVAKERAIRASQPPQAYRSVRHPSPPLYEPITPISLEQGVDSDEEMVKIEPDDPAFDWNTDPPELELVEHQERCTQKKSKARQKSTQRPSGDQSKANTSKKRDKPFARSSKPNVKKPPDVGGNNSFRISTPSPRRRERSNSIDGDFVIPDDVSFVDADASYYDGSSEHGETNSSHSDS
ncbi:hypothetical protein N0V83_009073 [Neocucurbitaria cava]|uniref:Uncharacterized protein n=1 Tax=Neocucurbitaria cava TaxID=798079 RepID=A0A9W8Y0E4_9PLEO|nr:hypothetical protein N0V83_009073 [Neocucurbitaria cava]